MKDMKPYVKQLTVFKFNGRDYQEMSNYDLEKTGFKLYDGEKLLEQAEYVKYPDRYYALLNKDGEIILETTSWKILKTFFDGRVTIGDVFTKEIEYFYKHVTTHEDFDPEDPKDKAIVELYNEMKDPESWLYRFEHCVYSGEKMDKVDINMLKWIGEALSDFLYRERK